MKHLYLELTRTLGARDIRKVVERRIDNLDRRVTEPMPASHDGDIINTLENRKADVRQQILALGGLDGAQV